MSTLTIGELFAGYGGLGMGVQSVLGGDLAWVSDIDPGSCKVLGHRFPDVPNLGDITAIDWDAVEPVDILTGGFPCQDVSSAGKRAGLRPGTRSGLWSHFAYAIAHWEALTRPAPAPTITSAKGNPQLSPRFTEWLMGLPDGWVTDVPGISRNEALRLCGNGVVPRQAAAGIAWCLARSEAAA